MGWYDSKEGRACLVHVSGMGGGWVAGWLVPWNGKNCVILFFPGRLGGGLFFIAGWAGDVDGKRRKYCHR